MFRKAQNAGMTTIKLSNFHSWRSFQKKLAETRLIQQLTRKKFQHKTKLVIAPLSKLEFLFFIIYNSYKARSSGCAGHSVSTTPSSAGCSRPAAHQVSHRAHVGRQHCRSRRQLQRKLTRMLAAGNHSNHLSTP